MLHTFCSSNAARQITDLQTSWCPLTTKTELFSTNSATCYALAYDMWQNSTFSIDISRSRPLYHVTNPQSQFARSCEGVAQLKDINIGKGKKMVCSKPLCLLINQSESFHNVLQFVRAFESFCFSNTMFSLKTSIFLSILKDSLGF